MWLRKERMAQYDSGLKAGVGVRGCNYLFTGEPIHTWLFGENRVIE